MKHDTCTHPALRAPLRGEDRKLPSRTSSYLPLLARNAQASAPIARQAGHTSHRFSNCKMSHSLGSGTGGLIPELLEFSFESLSDVCRDEIVDVPGKARHLPDQS